MGSYFGDLFKLTLIFRIISQIVIFQNIHKLTDVPQKDVSPHGSYTSTTMFSFTEKFEVSKVYLFMISSLTYSCLHQHLC